MTGVALVFGLVAAFLIAPREASMGDVQRLFYFHMPSAWVALGPAFTCVFGFGIAYLVTGKLRYDRVAAAAAEIGVLFTTITLLTGPIWAKASWGVYWTWEPRLTTTLILWFIYVGYLLLALGDASRAQARPPGRGVRHRRLDRRAHRVSSIWWWRTVHPRILGSGGFAMDSTMVLVLMLCLVAFTLLFLYLLILRAPHGESERAHRCSSQRRIGR